MFAISLTTDGYVENVYDTEIYVDEGVELFEITEEQKDAIWKSGDHGCWTFVDGVLIYTPRENQTT